MIVVFGGRGMVGSRFLELTKFETFAPTVEEVNLLDFNAVNKYLEEKKPEIIVNFAAITDVQGSEVESGNLEGKTYLVNALAPKSLAEISKKINAHLIQISTEYVFDGEKKTPYTETDLPNPINWYGKTKYFGEKFVQAIDNSYLIVRISMPFSIHYSLKKDIARNFLDMLRNDQRVKAVVDSDITPTLVDDIIYALILLIQKKARGIYHIAPTNSTTPYMFAKALAHEFGLDETLINRVSFDEYNKDKRAKLIRHSWLSPAKFVQEYGRGTLHSIDDSLARFKKLSTSSDW